MLGLQRVTIAQHQCALRLRDGMIETILEPGVYRVFNPLNRVRIEVFDLSVPEFNHAHLEFLLKERADLCERYLHMADLGDTEVGLVYADGKLYDVLPPGRRQAYWKGPIDIRVDVIDIAEDYRVPRKLAVLILKLSRTAAQTLVSTEVADRNVGLLFVDGELVGTLAPGSHAFWRFNRNIRVEHVDTRWQAMEVQGQDILSKDKVSLRVNLSASYRVEDPIKARQELARFDDFLYRELQFALRQAVGARTLDALLGNKDALDVAIFETVAGKVSEYGLVVRGVGVKDVILPGDMKTILNQVVEAEKVAQANVIKRREETAATRSLLNTAKLMDDHPTLMRLKELEALEKVTDKIGSLTVFGGMDGVMKDLIRIQAK